MDGALRKQHCFLEHLPNACDFAFVELDLSHILTDDTMNAHAQDVKDRDRGQKTTDCKRNTY